MGLKYASIECILGLLYQVSQAITSSLALRLVSKYWPCKRFTFSEPNSVSLQTLFQQLPRQFIEAAMLYYLGIALKL